MCVCVCVCVCVFRTGFDRRGSRATGGQVASRRGGGWVGHLEMKRGISKDEILFCCSVPGLTNQPDWPDL